MSIAPEKETQFSKTSELGIGDAAVGSTFTG
jgi:hypothetical protein